MSQKKSKNYELPVCNKKNRHVWIETTTRDKLTLLVKFLDFPSSKIFELPKHILKNPKGSLKQVSYNKNIVISYQLSNRQLRRKQLIGKLLWTRIMRVYNSTKQIIIVVSRLQVLFEMNTYTMWIERVCCKPSSGDNVDWIRLQLCSLIVGTMRSDAIDRHVPIQRDTIVEKTIWIL